MPQSLNRYTYALNNPPAYSDSTGLDWYIDKDRNVHWYKPGEQPDGFEPFNPPNNQYNISNTQSVILNPNGPNPNGTTQAERQGWDYGPHVDDSSGAAALVTTAGVVTVAQPEGPGQG